MSYDIPNTPEQLFSQNCDDCSVDNDFNQTNINTEETLMASTDLLTFTREENVPADPTINTVYITKGDVADEAEITIIGDDPTVRRSLINRSDVQQMINMSTQGFSTTIIRENITARDADNHTVNQMVLVLDATADPDVDSGAATYVYDTALGGYHRIAEFESMDTVITWDSITDGPNATPAQIDAAMSKLAKITFDADNFLVANNVTLNTTYRKGSW